MEIIPVIHFNSEIQVKTNLTICEKLGIKKVFIIDHMFGNESIIDVSLQMKMLFPDMWIGVNLLGLTANDAVHFSGISQLDAVWSDGILTKEEYSNVDSDILFFGGVAFKYQKQPVDLEIACHEAIECTDVATTSGPGTGHAASLMKIQTIRKALGTHPMAIASGVDSSNIKQYKDAGVDYVLVASSIVERINGEEIFSEKSLSELINKNI